MPILKHRTTFEIARSLKAFLRLDVGFTRGEVPDSEQQGGAQTQQLRQARDQINQTEQLNQQIISKNKQIARLRAKLEAVSAGALATARKTPLVGERERKLAVLDDAFPHLLSAFRIAEYNAYLEEWKDAVVCSTASSFPLLR